MLGYIYRYIKGCIGRSGRGIECILKGARGGGGRGRVLRGDYGLAEDRPDRPLR